MNLLKQIVDLVRLNLGEIPRHLGSIAVIAISIACVVGVLISMLSVGAGIQAMTMKNVRQDRVVVRGTAADGLSSDAIQVVDRTPGSRRDESGRSVMSTNMLVTVAARKKGSGAKTMVSMIGVGSKFENVYPEFRITDGRLFRPGLHEMIAGKGAHTMYRGFEIGDQPTFEGIRWTVVGHFEANGGVAETWLLTDTETLRSAFNRSDYGDEVVVMLDSANRLNEFSAALHANPAIALDAIPEEKIREQLGKGMSGMVNFLSYFVGITMAIGATVGALNSMYAIVEGRQRKLATLRAIGFGSISIVVSIVIEALLLAAPGAFAGLLAAWIIFKGNIVNYSGFSFPLVINSGLAVTGLIWALVMALIGGLIPALRVIRMPVAVALRAI